jgi:hypothetical protein
VPEICDCSWMDESVIGEDEGRGEVPAPTANAPDPPNPARNRKIIKVAMLFDDAAMAVKISNRGIVVQ